MKALDDAVCSTGVSWIAGIYGLAVLLPQYFMEERLGRDFPPPLNHPEHFYGFIGVATAWQVAFLIISRDPARYRLMMIPGMLEKASFGLAAIVLVCCRAGSREPFWRSGLSICCGRCCFCGRS